MDSAPNNKRKAEALEETNKQEELVKKIAKFWSAVRAVCKDVSDEQMEKYKSDAGITDMDVLPHGSMFDGIVESVSCFLDVAGIVPKKEKDNDVVLLGNDVREHIVCGICETMTSFLLDPFFPFKKDQRHLHMDSVCVDCATSLVEKLANNEEFMCPLCSLEESIIDDGADMISEPPFFVYNPEKSVMAAAYRLLV
eukprot:jgi/Mesvir1/19845/Mv13135-RA.1